MYQAYWGFSRSPFSASNASVFASSPIHREALARLEFLLTSRSPLGLMIGGGGSGKSAVLSEWMLQAQRRGVLVARIATAAAEARDVLPQLAESLQVVIPRELAASWQAIVDRVRELGREGLQALVLLDDLDRAAASTLGLAERILAIPDSPLTMVATARPDSASRIGRCILEQAAMRIELTPWDESESREHIERALANAGRVQPSFESAAIRRLFQLSGGVPRRVNRLAELALLAGAAKNLPIVDGETVSAVYDELFAG